jgi:hypothetical protein
MKVFPLRPGTKAPLFAGSFHDARPIEDWPDHGGQWGFEPESEGMCVVDVDPGGEYDDPDCTFVVDTPRGGKHFYYAGSLPPTASKLGPRVDTRGRASYVVLYRDDIPEAWELTAVPEWVVELCAKRRTNSRQAIGEVELDKPEAIVAGQQYLSRQEQPIEGQGSDFACYKAIARLRDLGLSDQTIFELMLEWTGFDEDWLWLKIENVEQYAENEPGCDIPPPSADWNIFAERSKEHIIDQGINEWTGKVPRDPKDMPEITFFDLDRMIPKIEDGCVGIMYGKRGDHKTNLLLTMLEQCSADRILYVAGEGAYGVERDRLPLRPGLGGRVRMVRRMPRFNSPDDISQFIRGNDLWKPDIVVFDTLATALFGIDENSSEAASLLTDNGAAGAVKHAWGCTVIIVAHTGKDASKGVRGNSGLEGNTDFLIFTEANKEKAVIKATLERMRDGYDGFSTYWQYMNDPNKVPLPTQISLQEYAAIVTEQSALTIGDSAEKLNLMRVLRQHHAWDWAHGLEPKELAEAMVDDEYAGIRPEPATQEEAQWKDVRKGWLKRINNFKNNSKWAKECWAEHYQPGGDEPILRWFCPTQQEDDIPV